MVVTRNIKSLSHSELKEFLENRFNVNTINGEVYYSTKLRAIVKLRFETVIEFPLRIKIITSNNVIQLKYIVDLTKVWLMTFVLSFSVFGVFYLVYKDVGTVFFGAIAAILTYSISVNNVRTALDKFVSNMFRKH